MNSSRKSELKKIKRREKQNKIRQALLVNEYVYVKYFNIYQEAAEYYNSLNRLYPSRPDLRKCDEFKALKLAANGAPIRVRIYNKALYTNMSTEKCDETPVQPAVETPVQPAVETPVQPAVETPVQPAVETPVQSAGRVPRKVMELKIPLLAPAVITETLSSQKEEIIQENILEVATEGIIREETPTFHPSLTEEIPQEIVDKIINELRDDPELQTIMTDIEEQLEFEQIGMDLDILDDRLEDELENLTW